MAICLTSLPFPDTAEGGEARAPAQIKRENQYMAQARRIDGARERAGVRRVRLRLGGFALRDHAGIIEGGGWVNTEGPARDRRKILC